MVSLRTVEGAPSFSSRYSSISGQVPAILNSLKHSQDHARQFEDISLRDCGRRDVLTDAGYCRLVMLDDEHGGMMSAAV